MISPHIANLLDATTAVRDSDLCAEDRAFLVATIAIALGVPICEIIAAVPVVLRERFPAGEVASA